MNKFINDACAIIAFFKGEKGCEKVTELLKQAETKETIIYMHSINVYEVYYDFYRAENKTKADEILKDIQEMPFIFVKDITNEIILYSAYFKAKYKMSLADSILLGQAKILDAKVISADRHEFEIVEKNEIIKFNWIR